MTATDSVATGRRAYNLNIDKPDTFTKMIKAHGTGHSLMHELAKEGDVLTAELMIAEGHMVDQPDENGKRPLHEAAFFGQGDMADLLLACGAEVDAAILPFGHTALYLAVMEGHHDVAQMLLTAGADVHVTDQLTGQSLLHIAATRGDMRMAGLLISSGINVLHEDFRGQTVHDYAVRARQVEMERLLLKVMMHHACYTCIAL
ncbi:MAG: ankyrin repeat domain-containing protein [Alphaproteobacteria bacterium]|nr:ankyrin repeat domain-containing protein [Alphaproteobacteria bacterium]